MYSLAIPYHNTVYLGQNHGFRSHDIKITEEIFSTSTTTSDTQHTHTISDKEGNAKSMH